MSKPGSPVVCSGGLRSKRRIYPAPRVSSKPMLTVLTGPFAHHKGLDAHNILRRVDGMATVGGLDATNAHAELEHSQLFELLRALQRRDRCQYKPIECGGPIGVDSDVA